MSALLPVQATFRADDYLAWEATQAERYEFVDGALVDIERRRVDVFRKLPDGFWRLAMPAIAQSHYSPDEYLALEASGNTKHEYLTSSPP